MVVFIVVVIAFLVVGVYVMLIRPMWELTKGFMALQRRVFMSTRVTGYGKGEFSTSAGVDVVYCMAHKGHITFHSIIGKTSNKPSEFLAHNMVLIIGDLTRQFQVAGLGNGPKLDITEVESGTHEIAFTLTEKAQNKLNAVVKV